MTVAKMASLDWKRVEAGYAMIGHDIPPLGGVLGSVAQGQTAGWRGGSASLSWLGMGLWVVLLCVASSVLAGEEGRTGPENRIQGYRRQVEGARECDRL